MPGPGRQGDQGLLQGRGREGRGGQVSDAAGGPKQEAAKKAAAHDWAGKQGPFFDDMRAARHKEAPNGKNILLCKKAAIQLRSQPALQNEKRNSRKATGLR